jgi:hypothetical protein
MNTLFLNRTFSQSFGHWLIGLAGPPRLALFSFQDQKVRIFNREGKKIKKGADFFGELARRFQREQIEFSVPENNRLPILLNGQKIGAVISDGSMRIRKEFIDDADVNDQCQRTGEIQTQITEDGARLRRSIQTGAGAGRADAANHGADSKRKKHSYRGNPDSLV